MLIPCIPSNLFRSAKEFDKRIKNNPRTITISYSESTESSKPSFKVNFF